MIHPLAQSSNGVNSVWYANKGPLRCVGNMNIEYHQQHFAELVCDKGEWKHGKVSLDPPVRAGQTLLANCVPKPTIPDCHDSFVSLGTNAAKMNNKLFCINPDTPMIVIDSDPTQKYNELTCDAGSGWKAPGASGTILRADAKFSVSCVSTTVAPIGCSIRDFYGNWQNFVHHQIYSCNANLKIEYAQKLFAALQCDNGEWKYGSKLVNPTLPAGQPLITRCVPVAASPCVFQDNRGNPNPTHVNNWVSCPSMNERIEYYQQHFAVLVCDNGEWKHGNEPLEPRVPAGQVLYVNCVSEQYIPVTTTTKLATRTPAITTTTITTVDSTTTTEEKNWTPASGESTDIIMDSTTATADKKWTPDSGKSTTTTTIMDSTTATAEKVSTTTIVCCVLGGIILIVLAIAAIFCYKNAKKRAEMSENADEMTYKNYEMSDSNMDEV